MPPVMGQPLSIMSQNQILPMNNNNYLKPMHSIKPFGKSPPLKPAKKFRDEQEEIQRCKRRIHFGQLNSVLQRSRSNSQLRRNERERNRVRMINMTFARLRQHIPDGYCKNKNKKLSKVDTLRGAIDYINGLQDLLDEHDAVSATFDDVIIPSTNNKENLVHDSLSEGSQSPGSEVNSTDFEESPTTQLNQATFSPEEEDLLDFGSWFQ